MGSKLLSSPERFFSRDGYVVFDDFNYEINADLWTVDESDAASTVKWVVPGSIIELLVSVDGEGALINTTNELFKLVADKAIVWEARLEHTEVNTDDGNIAVGLCDAMTKAVPITTSDAIAIPGSGAILYKLKDETEWSFQTEVNGTAVTTASNAETGAISSGTVQTLRVEITPRSSTEFEARPFLDGVQLRDTNGKPIMHVMSVTSATDMDFGVQLMGTHANDQVTIVDYLFCAQHRN